MTVFDQLAVSSERDLFLSGIPVFIQGSGRVPYRLENISGVYSCTCPSWRNTSRSIDKRTCKHLKGLLGDTEEEARVNGTTASPERAAEIKTRAAGRKLRPDEKAKLNGPPLILAHAYDGDLDPTGWWCSEKLDGVRGYWTGKEFLSRQGNVFHAPDWFKAGLPDHPLDGELYMGRQKFQETISIVKRLEPDDRWGLVTYQVFDAPHLVDSCVENRWHVAALSIANSTRAQMVQHTTIASKEQLFRRLNNIVAEGAEGLMIRKPGSLYEVGRSHSLLKCKRFLDAEATVIGHEPGKGRHKGRLGALIVRMPHVMLHPGYSEAKQFKIGTGLSDEVRKNPPPLGCKVTYRYTELTKDGIPKCGSFVRVKIDE